MKRFGRQLIAFGILGLIATFIVGASGPGPELRQQIGVIGAIAFVAIGGGFLLWLIGIVLGSEGKRVPAPVRMTDPLMSAPTKKCPQCAELVQQDALICRFCRYDFGGDGPASPPSAPRRWGNLPGG